MKKYDQKPKIVVGDITKAQLDELKLVECETYDSVIVRLMEVYKDAR